MPLFVVATPIGNLEDITLRAIEVLKSADLVACEDTRVTRRLLDRHGIVARTDSLHEHNEARKAPRLAELAASGKRIALVTNAGAPLVSDPGYRLVRECLARGAAVTPLPGASAVTTALVACGLPTHRFTFLGYPPRKSGARRRVFGTVASFEGSIVLFESPGRLGKTLADAACVLGERRAVIARELTKIHEEWIRGTLPELAARLAGSPVKGECTIVIEGLTRSKA